MSAAPLQERRSSFTRGSASGLRALLAVLLACLLLVVMAGIGHAVVTVERAELKGSTLRLEGSAAPNRTITVDGVAMGSSDGSGAFRIERSGFSAPADCTVSVNDGSATPTNARLSGCTVSSPPPPPEAPSLSSLSLSQTTVVGGTPVTGTVRLTSAAPSGGVEVALSSNNTAAATVPASVTVAAGATSATFTVSTNVVTNDQSSTIIGTAGGATRSSTLTVVRQSSTQQGSISLARGGLGSGTVTSQPAGVNCTFTADSTSGACNNVFFPTGTRVRLEARAAAGSRFRGWEFEVSCRDAPNVTIQAGIAHICRPAFVRR